MIENPRTDPDVPTVFSDNPEDGSMPETAMAENTIPELDGNISPMHGNAPVTTLASAGDGISDETETQKENQP